LLEVTDSSAENVGDAAGEKEEKKKRRRRNVSWVMRELPREEMREKEMEWAAGFHVHDSPFHFNLSCFILILAALAAQHVAAHAPHILK
jgi:hypothetical protein